MCYDNLGEDQLGTPSQRINKCSALTLKRKKNIWVALKNKNSNLLNASKLPVVHFVLIRAAVRIKQNFEEKSNIFLIKWKIRLFFPVDVNWQGKLTFNLLLFPMLFEEVPNVTFISITMMSHVIYNALLRQR